MTRPQYQIGLIFCLFLGLMHRSVAEEMSEHWRSTSGTGYSITGNVIMSPGKLTFANGQSLPLAEIGHQSGFMAMGEVVDGTVYRVTAPTNPRLKGGNRICGGRRLVPITYILVWSPKPLPGDRAPRSFAAFSTKTPPQAGGELSPCAIFNFNSSD